MTAGCRQLVCGGHTIKLDRPRLMGVLNVTPDSFSDGGRFLQPADAVARALRMQDAGADIIDVGGESTRPGAEALGATEELQRVMPVIEAIVPKLSVPVSIDTGKPEVMRAAVAAGAALINDVYALRHDGALAAAAELGVPVCLMHMQGRPREMQDEPAYEDVVAEVKAFLLRRADACRQHGIRPENIVLDPGFGFGKTLQHNIALFRALPELAACGYPLLVGVSRKTMIGHLTGRDVGARLPGSVTAAALAALGGAAILRVHDVAASRDALRVATALGSLNA